MQEAYTKSLQIIKQMNIKTEREYIKIVNMYKILSLQSLKYVAQKRFKEIVEIAKKV